MKLLGMFELLIRWRMTRMKNDARSAAARDGGWVTSMQEKTEMIEF